MLSTWTASGDANEIFEFDGVHWYKIVKPKKQDGANTEIATKFIAPELNLDISSTVNNDIVEIAGSSNHIVKTSVRMSVTKSNKTCESKYLAVLKNILETGSTKTDRTGVGTKSLFGKTIEYDLREGFPLFTTKKIPFNMIKEELLFFLSGSRDTKVLSKKGIKIWEGNTSKEFLESRGLDYEEGDMGPGYGYQWRNFNGQGIDQIADLIKKLKENPDDRRMIVSAWNPAQLDEMALPPCHCFFQCYVDGEFLDLMLYQRSADMFLGVPFNVASYSLLMHILGKICGLTPRRLIHNMGDCHIYLNHIDQVKEQLSRDPKDLCSIEIGDIDDIDKIDSKSIKIVNYVSHPAIKAEMAI